MGIFGGSDEKKAEEARMVAQTRENQDNALRCAYDGADYNARLIAFANVYAGGGQVDGAIWGFNNKNAETALREFITLMTDL
jgi:hypothetical protein